MKHILFDLKDCPSELLDNEEHIRMSLYVAAKVSNSKLINLNAHKFKPRGVTGLAMLADSHISIHTWPEKNIAKCDIFTCGEKCLPELAVQYLTEAFKAAETTSQEYEKNLIMDLITKPLILQLRKIANFIRIGRGNKECYWYALTLTIYALIGDL